MQTETMIAEARLTTSTAKDLAAALRDARGQDLTVDASGVTSLGALAVQVLLSAQQTWDEDGFAFRVCPQSTAFAEAARSAGLEQDRFVGSHDE